MKKQEINFISPEKEVIVGIGFVLSKHLTGKTSELMVEVDDGKEKKEVKVPVSFIGGSFDMMRPQLHALLDEWLDIYEYSRETEDEKLRRREVRKTHPENGKPQVWMPKREQD